MEYRSLGRSATSVSRIALGCGNFGGIGSAPSFFGQGESEAEAVALMDAAWEAGITLFDTADAYGGGRSERWIGNWLRGKGPDVRDRLRICTKVFHSVEGDPRDEGLSRERILRQVEGSLARLGVDCVDLYLAHEPDAETPVEETVGAFEELEFLVAKTSSRQRRTSAKGKRREGQIARRSRTRTRRPSNADVRRPPTRSAPHRSSRCGRGGG